MAPLRVKPANGDLEEELDLDPDIPAPYSPTAWGRLISPGSFRGKAPTTTTASSSQRRFKKTRTLKSVQQEAADIVAACDGNNDGVISLAELTSAVAQKPDVRQEVGSVSVVRAARCRVHALQLSVRDRRSLPMVCPRR